MAGSLRQLRRALHRHLDTHLPGAPGDGRDGHSGNAIVPQVAAKVVRAFMDGMAEAGRQ